MLADQRTFYLHLPGSVNGYEATAQGMQRQVLRLPVGRVCHRRADFGRAALQHYQRFRSLAGEDRCAAGLEDSGFLEGDLWDCGAEILLVIEVDWGDHAEQWIDYVGGIQTPAHSGFEHHHFCTLFAEQMQSHRGDGLEIGRVHVDPARSYQLLRCPVDEVEGSNKFVYRDRLSAQTDALRGLDQMRRDVQTRAEPALTQNALDQGARGTLAVGACDVNKTGRVLRTA